jgi:hypothetical protein
VKAELDIMREDVRLLEGALAQCGDSTWRGNVAQTLSATDLADAAQAATDTRGWRSRLSGLIAKYAASHLVSSRLVPSRLFSSRLVSCPRIPSHPISSHSIPSHSTPSCRYDKKKAQLARNREIDPSLVLPDAIHQEMNNLLKQIDEVLARWQASSPIEKRNRAAAERGEGINAKEVTKPTPNPDRRTVHS